MRTQQRTRFQIWFYFNTVITITLYGEENASYIDDCFKLASHYENLFSNTIADSDISKINNAGGTPVTVDDDTIELLQKVFIMVI